VFAHDLSAPISHDLSAPISSVFVAGFARVLRGGVGLQPSAAARPLGSWTGCVMKQHL